MTMHTSGNRGSNVGAWLHASLAWAAIATAAAPSRGYPQGMPSSLTQFLQQTIGLTPNEIGAALAGTPVVKVLETADRREIAVFGIVSIAVPRAFQVERAADFRAAVSDPSRLRFALFSDPPSLSDVATFSMRHDEVQDVAHCRSGSCKLKLSSNAIAEVRASIESGSPSADSIATAYFRRRIVDYVTAYRARGNSALIVYDDKTSSTAAAEVFDSMLARSPYMYAYAPSLERYLRNYPKDKPAGVRETLFWSEDDLPSLKSTLTITHRLVYAPPELPGSTLIVSKQLYADHYLDGGLDVTALVDQTGDRAAAPAGVYHVFLRRLHFDNLPSGGLVNIRGKLIGQLRKQTTTALLNAKTGAEQAYAGRVH